MAQSTGRKQFVIFFSVLLFFAIRLQTGFASNAVVVKVAAGENWIDTGIDIRAGQSLWFAVSPEAQIQCGDRSSSAAGVDFPASSLAMLLPDAPLCSLISKVGKGGKPFLIGLTEKSFPADQAGRIFLGINADPFSQISGAWTVIISNAAMQKKLVPVSAVEPWTSTGIEIQSGSRVMFLIEPGSHINCDRRPTHANAEGVVPFEPELGRPVPSFTACGLIGKIGNEPPFKIGLNVDPFQTKASGILYLGINDTTLADNSGTFRVFVVVPL